METINDNKQGFLARIGIDIGYMTQAELTTFEISLLEPGGLITAWVDDANDDLPEEPN